MVITLTRSPRGRVIDRTNYCLNPSFEPNGNTSGWTYSWFGNGGAGTNDVITGQSWLARGSAIRKVWTTPPTSNADAGFVYLDSDWSAGKQKTASAFILQTGADNRKFWVQLKYQDANGTVIGQDYGLAIGAQNGINATISATGTAPAGTVKTSVWFVLTGDGTPMQNGHQLVLDTVLIEYGSQVLPYFDGATAAAGDVTYGWEGASDASRSFRYISDPSTIVHPDLILGYDSSRASRNVVHQLLSGLVAATILPAGGRAGVLRLLFSSAAAAASAELAHAGAGTWTLVDPENPTEALTYVVDGTVRKYQSDERMRWVLEVQYTEVTA